MSAQVSQPLSSLAPSMGPMPAKDMGLGRAMETGRGGLAWFVILTLFVGFVVFCLKPKWVQTSAGEMDYGKLLFWSLIIALLLILVGWLLAMAQRKY